MRVSLFDQLNDVAERRQENWNAYPQTDEVSTLEFTSKLEDLWAAIRLERARSAGGGNNAEIIKRARVEREIERLASSNGA